MIIMKFIKPQLKTLILVSPLLFGGTLSAATITCPEAGRGGRAPSSCECVDQESSEIKSTTADQICLTGKLDQVDGLIDFVVATGHGTLSLTPFQLSDVGSDGTFKIFVPLTEGGTYSVRISARYAQPIDAASGAVGYTDLTRDRKYTKILAPDFAALQVQFQGGALQTAISACKDQQKCNDRAEAEKAKCNLNCDQLALHTVSGDAVAVSSDQARICLVPGGTQQGVEQKITVSAVNTITDIDFTPARVVTLQTPASEVVKLPVTSTSDFCSGGFPFNVILAHGQNNVQVTVDNGKGTQKISVPLSVDLKGPRFCVEYIDSQGKPLGRTDQATPIIPAPLGNPLVLKVSAHTCGSDSAPESLFNGGTPIISVNGKDTGVFKKGDYFEASIASNQLKFPLNFAQVTLKDKLGNETAETVSFGYGKVQHPFDDQGKFQVAKGLVPDALAGFVSEPYLQDTLKGAVEKIANSREFKLNVLPKVFEIKQPSDHEAELCGEKSRIHKDKGQYAMLQIPDPKKIDDQAAIKEIDDMKVEIPSLYLLNQDTLWVQLKIKNFKRNAEIFAVTFNDTESTKDTNVDHLPGPIDQSGPFTFGVPVVPVKFTVQELALNMQIKFSKDETGHLQIAITDVPGRLLVEAMGMDARLMVLNCGKSGDQTRVHNTDGKTLSIDTNGCNGLGTVNGKVNGVGTTPTKFNQNLDHQFMETLGTIVSCNLPLQVKEKLAKFDDEAVTQAKFSLFGKQMFLDLFAPIGKADLNVSTAGISFGGTGLMMPAGFQEADKPEGNFDAQSYADALPEDLRKDPLFGPIYDYDEGEVDAPHEAQEIGSGINFVLKEDLINSLVFSSTLLLNDVVKSQGQGHQILDLDQKRLVEDAGMGLDTDCARKDGLSPLADTNNFNDWLCFPKPLRMDAIFNTILTQDPVVKAIAYDEAKLGGGKFVPLMIRTHLNSYFPPTVKLLNASPIQAWNGKSPVKSTKVLATLEVNLGSTLMDIFEEHPGDPKDTLHTGSGEIKDWCDADRVPFMNPAACQGEKTKKILPIVAFRTTGKVTVELLLSIKDNILTAEGGLASKIIGMDMENGKPKIDLDPAKTFVKFGVVENNTLTGDANLSSGMEENMKIILSQFLFGKENNGKGQDIRLRIPLQMPLDNFCALHPEVTEVCNCLVNTDGQWCGLVNTVDNLLKDLDIEKYGIESANIDELLLNITDPIFGAPRYLGVGLKADVQ